jgi:hypothetical protein
MKLQESIEVRKDTERADAIRAMKLAWEEAEPGRAAKAKQSRLNYLGSHQIKVHCSFSSSYAVVARSAKNTVKISSHG